MKNILLITSFFETPIHPNRAPYIEQLFIELKNSFKINIIRPINWLDLIHKRSFRINSFPNRWNEIPIQFPLYLNVPVIGRSVNWIPYYWGISRSLQKIKIIPDLFFGTWTYPDGYATMKMAEKYNKPFLIRVHGSDINILPNYPQLRHKIIQVLRTANLIISPSQALKKKIMEFGIDEIKIKVHYSGVDETKFYPISKAESQKYLGLKKETKKVLYIGNLKKEKGVIDLFYAAEMLHHRREDIEIFYIGMGENRKELENLINNSANKNKYTFVGAVNHDKLKYWINACDCITLPSYNEGVPNVLLEALACNQNIVATDVGGIPEIIEVSNRRLIVPGDIGLLCQHLYKALTEDKSFTKSAIQINSYKQLSEIISDEIKQII